MTIDFKTLLSNKSLRGRFLDESGLKESALTELLQVNDSDAIWPHLKTTLPFWISCEHGTAGGDYGVYEWHGHYFASTEWHGVHGPYASVQDACLQDETLNLYLSEESAADVATAKNRVSSILPEPESRKLLKGIVLVGDTIQLNDVAYRREVDGYIRA